MTFTDFQTMLRSCFPELKEDGTRWRNITAEVSLSEGYTVSHSSGLSVNWHPVGGWAYLSPRGFAVCGHRSLSEALEAEDLYAQERAAA